MKLRELQEEDAPLMLEWMHDESVIKYLYTDFASKTIEDCRTFIRESHDMQEHMHFAVTDDEDVYMGTVSLKHIDRERRSAEFAVSMRSCARGRGYSTYGMRELLRIGMQEQGLKDIYWCVTKNNRRAVSFYDKNGYARTRDVPEYISSVYTKEQQAEFIWYHIAG